MYFIWLLPKNEDSKYLSDIIDNLSRKFNSPKFSPHVTVFGYVNFKLPVIRDAIKKSIAELEPFTVIRSDLKYSNNFWKTIYFELRPNSFLSRIYKMLNNSLGENESFTFSPHFSLIYKNMNDSQKQQLISEIILKRNFIIDKIAIMKFSNNVDEWKIIETYSISV